MGTGAKNGGRALHDVPEKKGVSGGIGKTTRQFMSLKLSGLADSAVAPVTKKNPPQKSVRKAGMSLKTHGEKISVFWLSTMLLKIN